MQLTLVVFSCIFAVCKSIRRRLLSSENELLQRKLVETTLQRSVGRTGFFVHNVNRKARGKCGEVSTGVATAITKRQSPRALYSMILTSRYDFGLKLCGM